MPNLVLLQKTAKFAVDDLRYQKYVDEEVTMDTNLSRQNNTMFSA